MSYEAEVSRTNPSAFLFLVDRSGSMADPYGQGKRKADGVADAINKLLTNLSIKCTKSEGVRDYYDVGVISYGRQVEPALVGELAGRALASISAVANHPARIEERKSQEDDGDGGLSEVSVRFPVWFDAKAAGATPMCEALKLAHTTLQKWVTEHPYSFPPIVINITDGESTDGDPVADASALRALETQDGHVLLFNCHLSSRDAQPVFLPPTDSQLPDDLARDLFTMASAMPDKLRQMAEVKGISAPLGCKAMAFNADAVSLLKLLNVGTAVIATNTLPPHLR